MANTKNEKKTTKKTNPKKASSTPSTSVGFFARIKSFFKSNKPVTQPDITDDEGMSNAEITRFCTGAIIFLVSHYTEYRVIGSEHGACCDQCAQ